LWAFRNPAKEGERKKAALFFLKAALQCAQFLRTFGFLPAILSAKQKAR
jgi:hypothetical protein